jgi:hypothetical protein
MQRLPPHRSINLRKSEQGRATSRWLNGTSHAIRL